MKKPEKKTIAGWVIPPSRTITVADVMQISKLIGARVLLKYTPKRREFIAYTKGGAAATTKLRTLLSAFPEQKILA